MSGSCWMTIWLGCCGVGVGVDACIHLVEVGGIDDCDHEVVAVHFYLPWVVLFVCQCLSQAVVNAYSSACLGSVTSSFSGFGANLVNGFTGLMCWQCLRFCHLRLKWLWV